MISDNFSRLMKINEAIINLFEYPLKTDKPPEEPEWSVANKSYAGKFHPLGANTPVHATDGSGISHRLGWARPNPDDFVSNWGQKDAQGTPEKYDEKEYNELKAARREYNLWNQRGLDAYNPKAKTQNFSPSWNVRGDARREQTRAYLNYVRSNPERLARFRQQTSSNTIATRKY